MRSPTPAKKRAKKVLEMFQDFIALEKQDFYPPEKEARLVKRTPAVDDPRDYDRGSSYPFTNL